MILIFKLIGALTIKTHKFTYRSWELHAKHSVDFFDSLGAFAKIEYKSKDVTRVLPLQNDDLNESWITDKNRFIWDSVKNQRLSAAFKQSFKGAHIYDLNIIPMARLKTFNNLSRISYFLNIEYLLFFFFKKFGKFSINIYGILDPFASKDTTIAFKDFINFWGSSNFIHTELSNLLSIAYIRSNFLFDNKPLDYSLNSLNSCIFINFNPRIESPLFNIKLRKFFISNNLTIGSFGQVNSPIFKVFFLGNSSRSFLEFIEGRHLFSKYIIKANSNSLFLLGSSLLNYNSNIYVNLLKSLQKTSLKISFKFLYSKLSHPSVLDLGFIPGVNAKLYKSNAHNSLSYNIVYNLNNLNYKITKSFINIDDKSINYRDWAFQDVNIYIGTFGNVSLLKYKYVLPLTSVLEKDNVFININGLYVHASRVFSNHRHSLGFYKYYRFFFRNLEQFNVFSLNFFINILNFSKKWILKIIFFSKKRERIYSFFYYRHAAKSFSKISIEISSKFGFIFNSIFNSLTHNYFTNDIYSSASFEMSKASRSYNKLNNRTYY